MGAGKVLGRVASIFGSQGKQAAVNHAKGQAVAQAGVQPVKGSAPVFDPASWSSAILKQQYVDALSMSNARAPIIPVEDVCPLTKQIVIQKLADLAIQYPGKSIREIVMRATRNGVKDDHELLENLEAMSNPQIPAPPDHEELIRQLVQAAAAIKSAQATWAIKPGQSVGYADSEDMSDSCSGKLLEDWKKYSNPQR